MTNLNNRNIINNIFTINNIRNQSKNISNNITYLIFKYDIEKIIITFKKFSINPIYLKEKFFEININKNLYQDYSL